MIEFIFILALFATAAVASTQRGWACRGRSSGLRSPLVTLSCCFPQRHGENVDNPRAINGLGEKNTNSSLLLPRSRDESSASEACPFPAGRATPLPANPS